MQTTVYDSTGLQFSGAKDIGEIPMRSHQTHLRIEEG